MASFDELIEVLKSLLTEQFAPKPNYIRGVLGDGTGVVDVPSRPDYDYARFNRGSTEAFEIFNKNAPSVDGWPVLIGEFPWMPGLTQVVGTDWAAYEQSGWGDSVTTSDPHAPTHEWRDGFIGADPLNVYQRAIAPGRAYSAAATGTTVFVNAFEYSTGTIWPGTPGVDLSPVRDALATGNAQFAGIYVDTDNTLGVVTGTTAVDTAAFDPPLVTFPFGTIPIARVRIAGGQGGITESNIRDARILWDFPPTGTAISGPAGGDLTGTYPNPQVAGLFGSSLLNLSPSEGDVLMFSGTAWQPIAGVGGGGGWPFDIITVDLTDADADYSTITGAIAGASANDVIVAGPGTYTGRLDPSIALTIIGSGYRETVIEFESTGGAAPAVVHPTANLNLINCTIRDAGTAATVAIQCDVTATVNVIDCTVRADNTATTTLIYENGVSGGPTFNVRDCDLEAQGGSTDAFNINLAGSTVNLSGGSVDATGDVGVGSGGTFNVYHCRVLAGDFVGSPTYSGWYYNPNNALVSVADNQDATLTPKNLLYHSVSLNIYREATTSNDHADDDYFGDLWNIVHNASTPNRPDITRQAGGASDPFSHYIRLTSQAASTQMGMVLFLEAQDTYSLRGQTVSLSLDAWGTNISNIRAAVLEWSSTADTITSDVVGTWGTGNPTLATNWAYATTPSASTAITGTRTRYKFENISVDGSVNNLAVFIWTPDTEASGDLLNIARVQLELGPVSTNFVARSFESELAAVQRYFYAPDSNGAILHGFRQGTTVVRTAIFWPVEMRTAPTYSDNITAWNDAGTPGSTEMSGFDYNTNAWITITGSLTTSMAALTRNNGIFLATASTSFTGSAGDNAGVVFGSGVNMFLDARL